MPAYYNEIDPNAAAWLRELIARGLIAHGEVDERTILDVEPADLAGFTQCHFFAGIGGWSYALRLAGWPDDRPVWTGSPPCQPFSVAGQRKGRLDNRHLAPHFVGLVGAARPSVLFGEQVASSSVFGKVAKRAGRPAGRAPEWAWFDDLSDRLEAARYAVGASDIPAAGVGAPHIRQRAFFGAVQIEGLDNAASARHFAARQGPKGKARNQARLRGLERGRPPNPECSFDSSWRNGDWILCRDAKWRPVEPGSFPLADGIPARVGRLRGYGNAIVPQAAAEFIRAFWGVIG